MAISPKLVVRVGDAVADGLAERLTSHRSAILRVGAGNDRGSEMGPHHTGTSAQGRLPLNRAQASKAPPWWSMGGASFTGRRRIWLLGAVCSTG